MGKTLLLRVLPVLLASFAAGQNQITVERDVAVKMRDGVVLHADIYRPKTEGRFPVLLQRTPYNKDGEVDPTAVRRAAPNLPGCSLRQAAFRSHKCGEACP